MSYISKIDIEGTSYDVKDAEARASIDSVKETLNTMNVTLSADELAVGMAVGFSDSALTAGETETGVTLEATFTF